MREGERKRAEDGRKKEERKNPSDLFDCGECVGGSQQFTADCADNTKATV